MQGEEEEDEGGEGGGGEGGEHCFSFEGFGVGFGGEVGVRELFSCFRRKGMRKDGLFGIT